METTQQAPMTGEQQGQQQAHQTQPGAQFISSAQQAHDATERYLSTIYSGLASSGNAHQSQRIDALRTQAREFYRVLSNQPTREQALAITNIQQSIQWAVWAILTEPAR